MAEAKGAPALSEVREFLKPLLPPKFSKAKEFLLVAQKQIEGAKFFTIKIRISEPSVEGYAFVLQRGAGLYLLGKIASLESDSCSPEPLHQVFSQGTSGVWAVTAMSCSPVTLHQGSFTRYSVFLLKADSLSEVHSISSGGSFEADQRTDSDIHFKILESGEIEIERVSTYRRWDMETRKTLEEKTESQLLHWDGKAFTSQ